MIYDDDTSRRAYFPIESYENPDVADYPHDMPVELQQEIVELSELPGWSASRHTCGIGTKSTSRQTSSG